jgi:hypothetical protein
MIKPNQKLVNFNIDKKLPMKIVKKEEDGELVDAKVYGQIADIDKRFPDGIDKWYKEPEEGAPDAAADIPVWPSNLSELIPPALAGAMNNATKGMKNITEVAKTSVTGMFSGLNNLAKGGGAEIVALAKLDAVILEAKAELGEMSIANKDKITAGIDGEILKAGGITDAASLGKFTNGLGLGGLPGAESLGKLGEPSEVRALTSDGLVNFNIDKTGNFRDVMTEVDVAVFEGDDTTFERQKKRVRVYGDETALTEKYGPRNTETDIQTRYNDPPKPTGKLKTPAIGPVFENGKWTGLTGV